MLGALLSLLSAATFGMNIATLRRGVLAGSVLQALSITVPAGVPLFAVGCLLFGAFDEFLGLSLEAWGWFSAAGIVHFIGGRYGNYRATRALGAAQAGPVLQLSLLVSLGLAIVLLGEKVTVFSGFGMLLILVGPIIIVRSAVQKGEVRTRAGQRLNYLEGYTWSLVCAVGFGVSPVLIRFGLDDGGVEASIAGGLASYIAASVVIVLILAIPGNFAHFRSLDWRTASWFTVTGVLVFISQMLLYIALALAPVSIVAAVQRTSVVFRVIFSWMLNRDHEVLGFSALLGIAVSGLGVLAVTISVDVLEQFTPLPASAADVLRLSWP